MHTHVISPSRFYLLLFVCFLLLAACGQPAPSGTQTIATPEATPTSTPVLDAYGNPIVFPKTAPQKIVSLVPSMSEILAALKLQDRVVGVDYYTNYPDEMKKVQKVSNGQGQINIEGIVAMHPDLILSSGGITKQYDAQLKQLGFNVVDLPTPSFTETLEQIRIIGQLTFAKEAAATVTQQMQQQIDDIKAKVAGTETLRVLLEVDYDHSPGKPYVFGGGSFGDQMLAFANARNIFHENTSNGGYPQVTDENIIAANPQVIILTEYPKYDPQLVYQRSNWNNIEAVKKQRVYYINTDLMQRAGPRLVQGLRCVAQVIHPEKFSDALPDYCTAAAA